MDQFFDTFTKISIEKKIGILIGMLLVVLGGDYFLVMSTQFEEQASLTAKNEELQVQLLDKQQKAKDLTGFKREVERLRQRLREAEEQLPKKSEIPKLLKDINYEGQQSGLTISRFELQGEQQQGAFAAVPVRMVVEGNYHEIAVFLDRIAKLPRIVNVTNIVLGGAGEQNKKIVLQGSYTATTYRFLEQGK
ncbi:MAG: type 4a pilus biogenesis protein PilO [Pseudomonadota bacterium]